MRWGKSDMNRPDAEHRYVASILAILFCSIVWTLPARLAYAETLTISDVELKRLFATEFIDHRGRRQAVSQWRGKVLVINFWATWCAPCREEMPDFSHLQQKYLARGVQFIGIATESREKILPFATRNKLTYPLLAGGYEAIELSRSLGNTAGGIPYTLVLDKNGEPLLSHTGRLPASDLDALLDISSRQGCVDK